MAARFADTFPEMDAIIGVIQVPIFPPKIIAAAISNEIQPLLHIINAIARVALDACTTIVSNAPMAMNIKIEKYPIWVYSVSTAKISGLAFRSGTEFLRYSSPMNRNAKPSRNSPIEFRLLFCDKKKGRAIPIIGNTNSDTFTLKPNRAITQAVTVVPTLAPIMTAIDWPRLRRPAFTKLTTITVVADEL